MTIRRNVQFLSMTMTFIMLFSSFAGGQFAFNSDSLRSLIHSSTDKNVKLDALTAIAGGFLEAGMNDSAIDYFDSAISLAVYTDNIGILANMNVMKGKALFYSKGPRQALGAYKQGYVLSSGIHDSSIMAIALNGLGVMYQKLGRTDSALACYVELATIAEKKGYEKTLGMGYVNMGVLYQYEDDYDKANYYLDLSLPINRKHRVDLVALAQMNKGLICYMKDDFDSALIMYRQAMDIYREYGNSKNLADLYNNLGNTYTSLSDLDSADYFFTKAKDIYLEREDWYTFCQVYHNLARNAYYRGYYDNALKMLDSCLVHAKSTGNVLLESKAYFSKYDVYSFTGECKKAMENYLLYDSVFRFLYNLEKDELMAEKEMKYQNEKKQAIILSLEMENLKKSRQNYIYLFTGIGIIVLITFAFLYFRQKAVKNRIIAQQRIRQLEEEKKLLAAKSLVEGQEEERKRIAREIHDGLGVLLSAAKMQFSTIGIASPETKPLIEKASKMLEQASSDARKISHNMMPGLLTKLGLYEAVEDLFDKISETESLHVNTDISEDMKRLPENKEIMVYRIIQEIVNNTLKHSEAKSLRLSMQMHEDQLQIEYSDDGKGFDYDRMLDSKSIGLSSIQSRINFLNGKMKVHTSPGKGAAYNFLIPC